MILTLALALALVPQSDPPSPGTLRIVTGFPRGFRAYDHLKTASREIETACGGRVHVELISDPALMDNPLTRIESGAAEGGIAPTATLAQLSPVAGALALPLLFRDLKEAAAVMQRFQPRIDASLKEHDLALVAHAGMGFGYLMGLAPVDTPEQLRKARLWLPSKADMKSPLDTLVDHPVRIGMERVKASLETARGGGEGVDTVLSWPDFAIVKQWHTALRHVLDLPLFYVDIALLAKESALAKMEPADRAAVEKAFAKAMRAIEDERVAAAGEFRRVLEKNGLEFHEPTADERAAWDRFGAECAARLVDQHGADPALVDEVRRAVAEQRK